MCKYCEMKETEISSCAGEMLPDFCSIGDDKLCILNGNILTGKHDTRIEIKYCPMCGDKLEFKTYA